MNLLKCAFVVSAVCLSVVNGASLASAPNAEMMGGHYQGDMVLEPETNARGVAIRFPYGTSWTGGVVPYEFAPNISVNNSLFIVRMMRQMENLTSVNGVQCIRFREKNASDTRFITIFNGSGCYAPVGSWGNYVGVRGVSLMDSPYSTCMISGTIQHELNHVLGFYHEQSRPDRDTFVTIQWSNIQSASAYNFDKYNDSQVDTQMTPYDYGSVMHYSANAFAINSSAPTIIAVFNSSANLGQRIQLSPIDILEIQRFYGCVPTPPNPNATTTTTAPPVTTSTVTTRTTSTTSQTTATTTTSRTTTTTSATTTTSQTTTSATTVTTTSATTVTTTSQTTTTETTVTTTAGATSLWNNIQSQLALLFFALVSIIHILH